MSELEIDKIAMVYAMEHDMPAKLIRDYVTLVAKTDFKSLSGLEMFRNDGARKALMDYMPSTSSMGRTHDFELHSKRLIARLRTHGLIR